MKKKLDNGIQLFKVFLDTVDQLISQPRLFALSNQGQYINFRADDFKRKLALVVPDYIKPKLLMESFKTLQLIICEENRFTNVQNINGKPVRVLTVDKNKYDLLKSLKWTKDEL